jgi:hypothetical protein
MFAIRVNVLTLDKSYFIFNVYARPLALDLKPILKLIMIIDFEVVVLKFGKLKLNFH